MYLVRYKTSKHHISELPFKSLSQVNKFLKTCVKCEWTVLELRTLEEKEI